MRHLPVRTGSSQALDGTERADAEVDGGGGVATHQSRNDGRGAIGNGLDVGIHGLLRRPRIKYTPHVALLLPLKPMLTKERPHQTRRVDALAGGPDEPFGQRLATGPGMASSFNGIEHHRRVVSAVRVFEARDVRRDHGIDRVRSAPVSSSPIRRKGTDALKSLGGNPRKAPLIRNSRIGGT